MRNHQQLWVRGIVPAAVLGIGLQILVVAFAGWPPITGEFWGPDSYMRLARTLTCRGGLACEGGLFPGTNAPAGEVIHWPFLQDRLLMLGSVPLIPFLESDSAIVVSASLFGPILLLLSIGLILVAARGLVSPPGLYISGVLLVCQPWVFYAFAVPRTDHHGLQGTFFLGMMAGVLRLIRSPNSRRWALVTGVFLGLALWVSTEALVSCLPVLVGLGLLWLARGGVRWARANRYIHMAVVGVISLGLVVDGPPSRPWIPLFDRFSVVHWVLFALIGLFWWLAERWESSRGNRVEIRCLLASAGTAVIAGLMAVLFPDFFGGPMSGMDPRLGSIWLDHTSEFIPVLGEVLPSIRALHLVSPILAISATVSAMVWGDRKRRAGWGLVLGALLWFLGLGLLLHGRWVLYLHLLVPLPLAWVVGRAVTAAGRTHPALLRAMIHVAVLGLVTLAPLIVAVPLAAAGDGRRSETAERGRCGGSPLVPFLQDLKHRYGPGIVLAPAHWGGEIVFRTGLQTVASPYHRNAAGLMDSHGFMSATDFDDSRRIAARRGIDWIIVCRGHPWFPIVHATESESLYSMLSDGRSPTWLRPMTLLPDSLNRSFRVFSVQIGDLGQGGSR